MRALPPPHSMMRRPKIEMRLSRSPTWQDTSISCTARPAGAHASPSTTTSAMDFSTQ
jgi:hypothetical protein